MIPTRRGSRGITTVELCLIVLAALAVIAFCLWFFSDGRR